MPTYLSDLPTWDEIERRLREKNEDESEVSRLKQAYWDEASQTEDVKQLPPVRIDALKSRLFEVPVDEMQNIGKPPTPSGPEAAPSSDGPLLIPKKGIIEGAKGLAKAAAQLATGNEPEPVPYPDEPPEPPGPSIGAIAKDAARAILALPTHAIGATLQQIIGPMAQLADKFVIPSPQPHQERDVAPQVKPPGWQPGIGPDTSAVTGLQKSIDAIQGAGQPPEQVLPPRFAADRGPAPVIRQYETPLGAEAADLMGAAGEMVPDLAAIGVGAKGAQLLARSLSKRLVAAGPDALLTAANTAAAAPLVRMGTVGAGMAAADILKSLGKTGDLPPANEVLNAIMTGATLSTLPMLPGASTSGHLAKNFGVGYLMASTQGADPRESFKSGILFAGAPEILKIGKIVPRNARDQFFHDLHKYQREGLIIAKNRGLSGKEAIDFATDHAEKKHTEKYPWMKMFNAATKDPTEAQRIWDELADDQKKLLGKIAKKNYPERYGKYSPMDAAEEVFKDLLKPAELPEQPAQPEPREPAIQIEPETPKERALREKREAKREPTIVAPPGSEMAVARAGQAPVANPRPAITFPPEQVSPAIRLAGGVRITAAPDAGQAGLEFGPQGGPAPPEPPVYAPPKPSITIAEGEKPTPRKVPAITLEEGTDAEQGRVEETVPPYESRRAGEVLRDLTGGREGVPGAPVPEGPPGAEAGKEVKQEVPVRAEREGTVQPEGQGRGGAPVEQREDLGPEAFIPSMPEEGREEALDEPRLQGVPSPGERAKRAPDPIAKGSRFVTEELAKIGRDDADLENLFKVTQSGPPDIHFVTREGENSHYDRMIVAKGLMEKLGLFPLADDGRVLLYSSDHPAFSGANGFAYGRNIFINADRTNNLLSAVMRHEWGHHIITWIPRMKDERAKSEFIKFVKGAGDLVDLKEWMSTHRHPLYMKHYEAIGRARADIEATKKDRTFDEDVKEALLEEYRREIRKNTRFLNEEIASNFLAEVWENPRMLRVISQGHPVLGKAISQELVRYVAEKRAALDLLLGVAPGELDSLHKIGKNLKAYLEASSIEKTIPKKGKPGNVRPEDVQEQATKIHDMLVETQKKLFELSKRAVEVTRLGEEVVAETAALERPSGAVTPQGGMTVRGPTEDRRAFEKKPAKGAPAPPTDLEELRAKGKVPPPVVEPKLQDAERDTEDTLKNGRYAVLTSNKRGRDPKKNAAADRKLRARLDDMGLEYVPAPGNYGYPEDSYIVFGATGDQAVTLGRQFKQESVVVNDPDGKSGLYYTTGKNAGKYNPYDPQRVVIGDADSIKDYYTDLNGVRFQHQVDFDQLLDQPPTRYWHFTRNLEGVKSGGIIPGGGPGAGMTGGRKEVSLYEAGGKRVPEELVRRGAARPGGGALKIETPRIKSLDINSPEARAIIKRGELLTARGKGPGTVSYFIDQAKKRGYDAFDDNGTVQVFGKVKPNEIAQAIEASSPEFPAEGELLPQGAGLPKHIREIPEDLRKKYVSEKPNSKFIRDAIRLSKMTISANELDALVETGRSAIGGYRDLGNIFSAVYGKNARLFSKVHAAMSPDQAVKTTLRESVVLFGRYLKAFDENGNPPSRELVERIVDSVTVARYPSRKKNLLRVLTGGELSGPKVEPFAEAPWNLRRFVHDTWTRVMSGLTNRPDVRSAAVNLLGRINEVANKRGLEIAETQEASWAVVRPLIVELRNLEREGIGSAEKYIPGVISKLTHEQVREAWSPLKLFMEDPGVREALRENGILEVTDRFIAEYEKGREYESGKAVDPASERSLRRAIRRIYRNDAAIRVEEREAERRKNARAAAWDLELGKGIPEKEPEIGEIPEAEPSFQDAERRLTAEDQFEIDRSRRRLAKGQDTVSILKRAREIAGGPGRFALAYKRWSGDLPQPHGEAAERVRAFTVEGFARDLIDGNPAAVRAVEAVRAEKEPEDLTQFQAARGYAVSPRSAFTALMSRPSRTTAEDFLSSLKEAGEESFGLIRKLRNNPLNTLKQVIGLPDGSRQEIIEGVKSHIRSREIPFGAEGVPTFQDAEKKRAPVFYSKLQRTLEERMPNVTSPDQVRGIVKSGGVKPEEVEWSGLEEFLAGKKAVTKADLLRHLRENDVQVQEVEKPGARIRPEFLRETPHQYIFGIGPKEEAVGKGTVGSREEAQDYMDRMAEREQASGTKFSSYVLPGGENYRELLLTMPGKGGPEREVNRHGARVALLKDQPVRMEYPTDEGLTHETLTRPSELDDLTGHARFFIQSGERAPEFRGAHWDEPNVLAHVRFNDRTDAEGKRVLFLEEVQADRNIEMNDAIRAAKKARAEGRVQEAEKHEAEAKRLRDMMPFADSHNELIMKRMIRYAAENGYDKIAWTTGEQQADRYDLSKQIDAIDYDRDNDLPTQEGPAFSFKAVRGKDRTEAGMLTGETVLEKRHQSQKQLAESLGKEVAQKIVDNVGRKAGYPEGSGLLEGVDLKVGGEGKKQIYDVMLPSIANKIGKRFGARAGTTEIASSEDTPLRTKLREHGFNPDSDKGDIQHLVDAGRRSGIGVTWLSKNDINAIDRGEHLQRTATTNPVHSLDITPAMRTSAVEEGFPQFQGAIPFPERHVETKEEGPVTEEDTRKALEAEDRGVRMADEIARRENDKELGLGADLGAPFIEIPEEPLLQAAQAGPPPKHYVIPEEKLWDRIRKNVQDKYLWLKKAQGAVAEQDRSPIEEAADTYLGQELKGSRTSARQRENDEALVKPLGTQMNRAAKLGLSVKGVEDFLYARHAGERNSYIATINPEFPDAGSGISNAEAAAILAGSGSQKYGVSAFSKTQLAQLKNVGESIDKITGRRLSLMESYGLISHDVANDLRARWKHYVPLKGISGDEEIAGVRGLGVGKGFDVRGPESKRALGRESLATDIIAHSLADLETTVMRGENNLVGNRFYRFVYEHPDPALWEINKVVNNRMLRNGRVIDVPQLLREDPRVFSTKIDGKEHLITIHHPELAAALKELNPVRAGAAVRAFATVNRYLAAVNTSMNPGFLIPNLVRDVQTAGINLSAEESRGFASAAMMNVPRAIKGAWGVLRDRNSSGEYEDYFREFERAGGKTDWANIYSLEEAAKNVEAMMHDKGRVKEGLLSLKKFMEDANSAIENGTRLSAYVEARKRGWSKDSAASLAKNLTVNFERKGVYGQAINAMYLFSNASLQGTARIFQAAYHSPSVRKVLAAITATQFGLAMLSRSMGGKDDDDVDYYDRVPSWVKERNIVVMRPGTKGKYYKIPLPYGYNIPAVAGMVAENMVNGRNKNPLHNAGSLFNAAWGSFNPISGGSVSFSPEGLAQLVTPTALRPLVDIAVNRDFAGRNIHSAPNPFDLPEPKYTHPWRGTEPAYTSMAKALNDLTGGDDVKPGKLNASGEDIKYALGAIGGGLGQLFQQTGALPWTAKDLKSYQIPIGSRFVGEQWPGIIDREFTAQVNELEYIKDKLAKALETGDTARFGALSEQYSDVIPHIRRGITLRMRLAKMKKDPKNEEIVQKFQKDFLAKLYGAGWEVIEP